MNSAAAAREASQTKLNNAQLGAVAAQINRDNAQARVATAQEAGILSDNVAKSKDAQIYNTPYIGTALRYAEKLSPLASSALSLSHMLKPTIKIGGRGAQNNMGKPVTIPPAKPEIPNQPSNSKVDAIRGYINKYPRRSK